MSGYKKNILKFLLIVFFTTSVRSLGLAQEGSIDQLAWLPKPGVMVRLSSESSSSVLKGIIIHPENALKFDFIVDQGDRSLNQAQKKIEYTKLIKYFLASLAVPDQDQWVTY